jgi:LysM repeat protein
MEEPMTGGRKAAIVMTAMVVVAAVAVAALSRVGGDDGGGGRKGPNVPAGSPLPAEAPTTTRAPGDLLTAYVVTRGDTLTSIARRFSVSTAAIIAANQLVDPDRLAEGQHIMIPPPAPIALVLTPTSTSGGQPIEIRLTGAKPAENVTFTVTTPAGTFSGPPHAATYDGTVVTSYRPDPGALGGLGTVSATGDRGTVARASFGIVG